MGYFSRLSLALEERASRENEPLSRRERIQNRIDELRDRLGDFDKASSKRNWSPPPFAMIPDRRIMRREDLRYIVPEKLYTYEEVLAALAVAEDELSRMNRGYVSSVAVLVPGQMFIRPSFSH